MSVYVDPLVRWGGSKTFRWKESCHMIADTADELHAFAKRIGLKREWAQNGLLLHYDLNASKRCLAVRSGAEELTMLEMGARLKTAREQRLVDLRR